MNQLIVSLLVESSAEQSCSCSSAADNGSSFKIEMSLHIFWIWKCSGDPADLCIAISLEPQSQRIVSSLPAYCLNLQVWIHTQYGQGAGTLGTKQVSSLIVLLRSASHRAWGNVIKWLRLHISFGGGSEHKTVPQWLQHSYWSIC